MFQKHPAFDLTFIRRECLCRFGWHPKTLNPWVRTWKFLPHIKNIPLLSAVNAEVQEEKWCQSSVEAESFVPSQGPNLVASQWVPLGKTQWDTVSPTEEGRHYLLVLARQWFPVSAPGSTTSSKLLQSACHCPKHSAGTAALLGSAEQCCLTPVQGSGSHWGPGGIRKAAVNLKIQEQGKLPPSAPLQKATVCTNIVLTIPFWMMILGAFQSCSLHIMNIQNSGNISSWLRLLKLRGHKRK